jgi:hypothetical protein
MLASHTHAYRTPHFPLPSISQPSLPSIIPPLYPTTLLFNPSHSHQPSPQFLPRQTRLLDNNLHALILLPNLLPQALLIHLHHSNPAHRNNHTLQPLQCRERVQTMPIRNRAAIEIEDDGTGTTFDGSDGVLLCGQEHLRHGLFD